MCQEVLDDVGGFTSTEAIGLLGMGDQDVHPDFHTVPKLCSGFKEKKTLYINVIKIIGGVQRRPFSPFLLLFKLFIPVQVFALDSTGKGVKHEHLTCTLK